MIKLTDYIAKRLKEVYKVNHFFMVSGGGAMHLNDSLGRYIPYTANHHEQACAIAAEGYARVNQKLGVVNVTTGPGGLNTLNGVMGQWTDSIPVLYLSGQVKYTTMLACCPELSLRQLGDQEVDIISVVKPLTKYAVTVFDPTEIKYHLDKAIYEATHGRKGPVWLDIPMNVQGALIDEDNLKEFIPPAEAAKTDLKIDEILTKLKSAKRPLIVAGHGIRLASQEYNLLPLLEKMNVPVLTTFSSFDLVPTNHPLFAGRFGTVGQRAGNFVLQNADVILFLGTRNTIRQISYNWENYAKNAYKIIVDIDEAELKKPTVKPDLAVCADLADLMPTLLEKAEDLFRPDWIQYCRAVNEKYNFEHTQEYHSKPNERVNAYHFMHVLGEKLQENDIMSVANGSACVCTHQVGVVKKGQRQFWNAGDASMGYALPASIGACMDAAGRRVVCLEGDGSIMMNLQELETIGFNRYPIKVFVINNAGYSSIRQTQRNFFQGHMTGSGADSGVGMPDFKKLAAGFSLPFVRIENAENMPRQIEQVLSMEGPVLCEVMVEKEYAFTPKLSARKLSDGTMVSPSLEDMFPFLDRDEFEKNMIKQ